MSTILIGGIIMKRQEAWEKFKETGKIEYYLEYKRLQKK